MERLGESGGTAMNEASARSRATPTSTYRVHADLVHRTHLQLGGAPTVVSCQSTIGQPDAGAATVALSNQVTRPDLGTFVLNTTIAVGDPQITTRNVSLNGKPLYDVTTQAPSTGASTTTLTLFPPILGLHQVSTTSDGTTFTVVADGRQSVAMPVQTNLSGFKFQDGQPPPKVTIPPGVNSAIAQLMVSAGTQLPTCLAAQTTSSSSEAMQLALASSAVGDQRTGVRGLLLEVLRD